MTKKRFILLITFVALYLIVRLPQLGTDAVNPDGYNWHYRSEQFINGLKYFQFDKTYQHYHPGVTLMWVTGVPIEIFKQVTGQSVYDHTNFLQFHIVAKLSLVIIQLALSIWVFYLLTEHLGQIKSFFITTLFSLEPFFLGNSRLNHMDTLLALLLFIGLLLTFKHLKNPNNKMGILAGLVLALSFLTKSIAIGAVLYAMLASFVFLRNTKARKTTIPYFVPMTISFILFTFLFFPALWVKPIFYITEIFSEAERVGIRKGHGQIVMGEYTRDAGLGFYPLVLLMKVSPFTLLGVGIYIAAVLRGLLEKGAKSRFLMGLAKIYNSGLVLFLSVFYVGYFLVMSYPAKKIDRYILPLYPWLALLAVLGLSYAYKFLKTKYSRVYKKAFYGVTSFLVLIFLAAPLAEKFPYYFTYTNPMFGGPDKANQIIAQKPFGIGIPALKDHILENYGDYPNLGFYDTKPMKAIYPNSKVFDVRVNGPSDYGIMVLGPNEETPPEVIETGKVYEKSSAIYINGLEYWRVYVKKEP